MKKLSAVFAIVLTLSAFVPMKGEAKPYYCQVALQRCYDQCRDHFGDTGLEPFCDLGCLLGYAGCGPA